MTDAQPFERPPLLTNTITEFFRRDIKLPGEKDKSLDVVRSGSTESGSEERTVAPEPVNPLAEYEAGLSRERTAKATGAKPDDLAQEAMEQLEKRKA
jgi:hypothetical protein